jgi:predicted GNAT family N-acyltransferase
MLNHLIIREIETNDYHKGFMDVINIFTRKATKVSYEAFDEYLKKTLNQNAIILVAESDNIIIGTLKILKEYKLHNNLTIMAHIEDVVVKDGYRHMKVASNLLEKAQEYTKDCYKTTLSCKTELIPLYETAGFSQAGIALTLYNLISSSVMPSI